MQSYASCSCDVYYWGDNNGHFLIQLLLTTTITSNSRMNSNYTIITVKLFIINNLDKIKEKKNDNND